MDIREQIRVYLSFSKKERIGMVILLIITMLTWVIPCFFSEDEIPEAALHFTPVELEEKLVLLKEKRVYPQFRDSLPYYNHAAASQKKFDQKKNLSLDINLADSSEWERLKGIGERLSSRIVRYRERLGGFVAFEQVKEVYGIDDTLFMEIKPHLVFKDEYMVRKIPLNTADYTQLRKHPYVTHVMAKIILAFRKTHGRIENKEKIFELEGIDPKEIQRVLPYLSFD